MGEESTLADKVSNPIANLISVPLQSNYDCCFGPKDANRYLLNIQPVIPFALDEHWNLITRTIVPLENIEETTLRAGSHFGFGDITQSFFFSPTPKPGDVMWGVGPAFLWPSATDAMIGSRQWGTGPTIVLLNQQNGWTVGALANHIWSFAGESKRDNVSTTFVQPFIGHNWPDTTGVTFSTETSYDWIHDAWSVPLNLIVSHIVKFGTQPVSLQLGGRWYPATIPEGPRWGIRFTLNFLFPE